MSDSPFLSDVVVHLNAFAKAKGVAIDQVHVCLSFAEESSIIVQGLIVTEPTDPQGATMIQGSTTDDSQALVIRDNHVIKAEFKLTPIAANPIGFHTEAKS